MSEGYAVCGEAGAVFRCLTVSTALRVDHSNKQQEDGCSGGNKERRRFRHGGLGCSSY